MAKSNVKKGQVKKAAPKVIKKATKSASTASSKRSSVGTPLLAKKTKDYKFPKPHTKTIKAYKNMHDYFALNEKYTSYGMSTRCIHAGNEPSAEFSGVSPAIDLSTTYSQVAPGEPEAFDYARCGNPTRLCLERTLASMEGGKFAFATSSGIAATVAIMSLLKDGDHILCVDDVYGGTQRFLRRVLGENTKVEIDFANFQEMKNFRKHLKPNTRIVWLETPTNPTLQVLDVPKIAKELKGSGILFVVDNTFATPINQNPLSQGADVVVHSITKYIGGHSDVVAGGIILNDKELYDRLFFITKTIGSGISAFDAYLALRGAKTLEVRVQRAQSNAMKIAETLEKHKKVQRILYPGLKSHPQHDIAKKNMRGYGGMLSFYVKGGVKQAGTFLKSLKVFTLAESLGGVESLAECPALMTHGSVPPAHRALLGIEDNFIRLSVGIENEADLVNDVKQALEKM